MFSAIVSALSGPALNRGWGHYVVFLVVNNKINIVVKHFAPLCKKLILKVSVYPRTDHFSKKLFFTFFRYM